MSADGAWHADAIVVLGAPLGPGGALTDIVRERVHAGVALWREGRAPLLFMCGGVTRQAGGLAESEAMASEARRLGVPEASLRLDRRSRTTHENAVEAARVLLPAQRRVWVVTQPFHRRRAQRSFRAVGFEAQAWFIADSLEFRAPWRAWRWRAREVVAAWRDRLRRRDPL